MFPLFHLSIEIPFVSVRTALMWQNMEYFCYEYVRLEVRVWKWHFKFDIHQPYKALVARKARRDR